MNIIVPSGGCLWSFKFSTDIFVSWITNIVAATLLLCVHRCSLGNPTSMAPEQCQPNLLILRGVDYCLPRDIVVVSPPNGEVLCLQRLCARDIMFLIICVVQFNYADFVCCMLQLSRSCMFFLLLYVVNFSCCMQYVVSCGGGSYIV